MVHRHNSESTVRFLLNFAQRKGPYVDESNNNGLYQKKKIVQGKWAVLAPKMAHMLITLNQLKDFFYKNFTE